MEIEYNKMEEIREYLNEEIERSIQLGHYIAGMHDREKHQDAFEDHQNAIKRDRQVLAWLDELEGKEVCLDQLRMDDVIELYKARIERKQNFVERETKEQMRMYGEIKHPEPYLEGNKREIKKLQRIIECIEELREKRSKEC